ncbi:MAG: hypothetical protein HBSIN02_02590 [Bacteroidia bacterium]|nr:MAG: hypothetical protein HBSIN02_02590 [Bacteroidia bacterium]
MDRSLFDYRQQHSSFGARHRLASFLFFLAGLFLTLLLLPRDSPFDLTNFQRVVHDGSLVFRIDLPVAGRFHVPGLVVLAVIFVLCLVLLASSMRFVRVLSRCGLRLSLAGLFLCATLIPPEWYFVSSASLVSLEMVLRTLAFLILLSGALRLFEGQRVPDRLLAAYRRARGLVLESPRPRFLASVFSLSLAATISVSTFVFDRIPHVQDSVAQLFHAKMFARGSLFAPAPPAPEFFEFLQMILRDRWFSQYPPGHTVLLSAGVMAGAPWLVNPLLGSLSLILLYGVGVQLSGERVGRLAALLGLFSPFLLFMSSEFMNHTTALFFFLAFVYFLFRAIDGKRVHDGILSGLSLGWLVMTRPYSAAALAVPFLLYAVVLVVRRTSALFRAAAGFVPAFGVMLLLLFLFNWATTGHPLVFGFQSLWGSRVNPGFFEVNAGQLHTPWKGLTQTLANLVGFNKYLFEWPVPSLLFVTVLLGLRRMRTRELLLAASGAMLAGAYLLYWFQDWCFGPRFLFEASGPAILLTAVAIDEIPSLLKERLRLPLSLETIRMSAAGMVLILITLGLCFNLPAHLRHYGNSYWGVDGRALKTVRQAGIDRGIVFVSSGYGGLFPQNDPLLEKGPIFARDLGERNQKLLRLYPTLPAWVLRGDSLERARKE